MKEDIKTLISWVREHDSRAAPSPWHVRPVTLAGGVRSTAVTLDTEDEDGLSERALANHGRCVVSAAAGHDAALIAHYRTAAPLLAAEVERLEAERAAIRAALVDSGTEPVTEDLARLVSLAVKQIADEVAKVERCSAEMDRLDSEREQLQRELWARDGDPRGGEDLGFTPEGNRWYKQSDTPPAFVLIEDARATIHPPEEPWLRREYQNGALVATSFHPSIRSAMRSAR